MVTVKFGLGADYYRLGLGEKKLSMGTCSE